MTMNQFKYRPLKHWKYQLTENYTRVIDVKPVRKFNNGFITLTEAGDLILIKGYCWDGASGPTFDTKDSMEPSLVHDALCQTIRQNGLSWGYKKYADLLFYQMLLEQGMPKWRANYWYWAVKKFGLRKREQ